MNTPSVTLIQKYNIPGPRYTSYPTAVEFGPMFSELKLREALSSLNMTNVSLSLYLHVPFCKELCYFCACHKIITRDRTLIKRFICALKRELACYQKYIPQSTPVSQIHWGGGSPNFLSLLETEEVFDMLRNTFPNISDSAEISIEADPRTTDLNRLALLRQLGFNRISFGVQDFNPRVQAAVNRIQSYEETAEVLNSARQLGFLGINFDLIYGLPQQTTTSFYNTLEKVLLLRPNRIALYGYAHVPWIKKTQRKLEKLALPSPEERIAIFSMSAKLLEENGYVHIGMDHFALPTDELVQAQTNGTLIRNFMGYTVSKGTHLIGFGPSSVSSFPTCYAQNTKDLEEYESALQKRKFPIERGKELSRDDLMRGGVINELLCFGRIDLERFETNWGIGFWQVFQDAARELSLYEKEEILWVDKNAIVLTPMGRYFMRNIAMSFDAYISNHKTNRQVFSKVL